MTTLNLYRCFNAINSKSKGHNSEIMCVELLKRYCAPIVLFTTEAVYPDKTNLIRLDKLVDTVAHKIFKTFDEHITCDIRKSVCLCNLKEIIDEHQYKFIKNIKNSTVFKMQIA